MYLGVDIGGTAVKIGLVSACGAVVDVATYPVAFDDYETPIIESVKRAMDEFLSLLKLTSDDLEGIGVSATGQVDVASGTVIGVAGHIKNWLGTTIKSDFEARYHLPVTVINDANAMILGEQWQGRAKNLAHVVGITIGTGVGGGVLVNGDILHGRLGIGGEIGHFSIDQGGLICTCGNVGCYERYGSTTALVNLVRERYESLGELPFEKDEIDGLKIFTTIKSGHELLKQVLDEWIICIAKGLVSLVHLFNPELIVIGGGVSCQEELFIVPIRNYVNAHVMPQFKKELKIESATLGNMAGLVGAVYYHMKHC